MKVSELLYNLMELEKSDPAMYFYAMEMLLENLLHNIKRYKKEAKKKDGK